MKRAALLALLLVIPSAARDLEGREAGKTTADVSAKNLERVVRTLVSFGTRGTLSSQSDPKRGIGGARDWLKSEFDKIAATSGGRMTVELQSFTQEAGKFPRIAKPTVLTNVVATLRGTQSPDRVYVVSGHYDSMCGSPTDGDCDAPGANDDASGVAAVLEAARVMAPHQYDATIVFMAVAGEEQGLVGSTYYAEQAKQKKVDVDGMFTNDIVGSTVGDDRKRVRVFAERDTPSGELARFVAEAAKAVPDFAVWLIDRKDRFLRNGDHGPFLERGFAAVRITEPNETYEHQHQNVRVEEGKQYGDLPQFLDYPYLANVTRVNVAALAALASAPAKPKDVKVLTRRLTNDTDLEWAANKEPDFDHYEIVWRETTAPRWEHSRAVGTVTSYTVKGISKDNYLFGVRAVDKDGHRSPAVAPVASREIPALRDELLSMLAVDQEVRRRWVKDRQNAAINQEMAAIDAKHVARMRAIIKEHGWPGKTMVGMRAAGAAWAIAQHGGSEFLHETLPLMKTAVEHGELEGGLYATSLDRTRVQDGQKQVYGSQFDTDGDKCEPLPMEDPEHVDERRKAIGLDSLAEYTKQLCELYKKKP